MVNKSFRYTDQDNNLYMQTHTKAFICVRDSTINCNKTKFTYSVLVNLLTNNFMNTSKCIIVMGLLIIFLEGCKTDDPATPSSINTVTNPITGRIWMDRNLGASQVATSSTDAASFGDLYQWGRAADGHQLRTSIATNSLSNSDVAGNANFILSPDFPYDWRNPQNDNLWQGINGINNPCPAGFRIPTEAEWSTERASWSSPNPAGAYASPLKLTQGGLRDENGLLDYVGSAGAYWSSTLDGGYSRSLIFYDDDALLVTYYRAYGGCIRCIKD